MASVPLILLGLGVLAGGICGIMFVTIPSLVAVGDGVGSAVEGDGSKIVGAVIGGFVLWISTGFFIVLIVGGLALTVFGAVAD